MNASPVSVLEKEDTAVAAASVVEEAPNVVIVPFGTKVVYEPLPHEMWPNVDNLITEDDTPVDNFYSEKQQKLLTRILHASQHALGENRRFIAVANVGLYISPDDDPIVPDVMVSLDVSLPDDIWTRGNRSYTVWGFKKTPELVLEIVSNKVGGEDDEKMDKYAQMRVPYYVIYDPEQNLDTQIVRIYELRGGVYELLEGYWISQLALGLVQWQGEFENRQDTWLRWCDHAGNLLLTGEEQAKEERRRTTQAEDRATRAEDRATQAEDRADKERQRTEKLAEQLRALGVDPDLPE